MKPSYNLEIQKMTRREKIKNAIHNNINDYGEVEVNKALIELDKKGINIAQGLGDDQAVWYEELRLARG